MSVFRGVLEGPFWPLVRNLVDFGVLLGLAFAQFGPLELQKALVAQPLAEHIALNAAGNPFLHSLTLLLPHLQRGGTCAAHGILLNIEDFQSKYRFQNRSQSQLIFLLDF